MIKQLLGSILLLGTACISNAQTITNYTTTDGLPSNNVLCLSTDVSNNIWFGTQAGVAKYDGSNWTVYNTTTDSAIPQNTITAILAARKDNKIWIGTDNGAAMYDGAKWTKYTTTDGLGSDRINHIFEAKNGDIWFSDFKGATKYDGTTFTNLDNTDGLPFGGVLDIKEALNGDILMATGLGGLFVYDGSKFSSYTVVDGLKSNSTTALAVEQNGNIWIGTGEGVSVFDTAYSHVKTFTRMYTMPAPDTLNPVEDIKIDSRGNVWVGIYVDYLVTVGGVAMYNGSTWANYDTDDGLAGPTIRKMALDNYNNLWVGTSAGVSKISSPYLTTQSMASNKVQIYPNPARDVVIINFGSKPELNTLQLFNYAGKLVLEKGINLSFSQSLDISDLRSGIYLLRIGSLASKVIVE